ncbi:hypothetical protein IMZ11_16600 [Microtetraspora sp. AC03309]|uniref:hypothetical protein n=1 Tax=Microtetraspora sp. AC03309 TaxID=2779376 RepID=UPI001E40CBEE|nr:hypothetical protein [Microtetraspora sp. AC03309]MCC5577247.1 hypothetical protein [Microtetraspora sp. AC03309]
MKARRRERLPVPIDVVWDAAISHQEVGHGRLIPLVIVDTRTRPDIEEMMRASRYLAEGEVLVNWARLPHDHVGLVLKHIRPVESTMVIRFNIERRGALIDQILRMQSLYMQTGVPGDRLIEKMDDTRILIEIPDTGFREVWDKLFKKVTIKALMARGLSRREAYSAFGEMIVQLRRFGDFRLPTRHPFR